MTARETRSIRINSAWMIAEQVGRQAISLLLTIWIARQLGPTDMGNLSFALSLYSLFGIVTTLGLNRILVREFSTRPSSRDQHQLVSSALAMRLVAGLVTGICTLAVCSAISPDNLLLVAILVPGYFFSAFDLVDLLFQSRLQSRKVAHARMAAFLASSAVKATLLWNGAGLLLIGAACLLDWILMGSALGWLYARQGGWPALHIPRLPMIKALLAESYIEIVAGFSGLAFMKLDQIMLQAMRGPAEVAIMAVSSRLTEAWYFVPSALVASTFPVIVRLRDSSPELAEVRIRRLYREVLWLSIVAAILISLCADDLVAFLYGSAYQGASTVLVIQVWCGVLMSLGIASGAWLIAHKKGILNLRRNLLGALVNVVLNLVLIPRHGAVGAAWATLAAFTCAYLFYDFLDPAMRTIGRDKLRSIVWR